MVIVVVVVVDDDDDDGNDDGERGCCYCSKTNSRDGVPTHVAPSNNPRSARATVAARTDTRHINGVTRVSDDQPKSAPRSTRCPPYKADIRAPKN